MNQRVAFVALFLALIALAACSQRTGEGSAPVATAVDDALPIPEGGRGSMTGMPDTPGPGHIGLPESAEADVLVDTPIEDGVDPSVTGGVELVSSSTGDAADPTRMADEPGPAEAVALVRAYYEAINAGDFNSAFSLWSDGGKASGQSRQQFIDGFASTQALSVEIQPPGRVDSAAGSRYIEVPVILSDIQADRSVRHHVGAYTLRRAVTDGASAEQRVWRIASADIREVRP
ncbi:MAG: hypothetical protein ACOH1P_07935 [Lysobacter sp.]